MCDKVLCLRQRLSSHNVLCLSLLLTLHRGYNSCKEEDHPPARYLPHLALDWGRESLCLYYKWREKREVTFNPISTRRFGFFLRTGVGRSENGWK